MPELPYRAVQCAVSGIHSEIEYRKNVDSVLEFLNGNYDKILKQLTAQMNDCAEKLEYEEAARFRDLIQSVKQVAQKQKITADDETDRDVVACASDGTDAAGTDFYIRSGSFSAGSFSYERGGR